MYYTGYTTSIEQVVVRIEADTHKEAVAKLRVGDFVAEVLVETYPAGMDSDYNETYGVDALFDEEGEEVVAGMMEDSFQFAEVV